MKRRVSKRMICFTGYIKQHETDTGYRENFDCYNSNATYIQSETLGECNSSEV